MALILAFFGVCATASALPQLKVAIKVGDPSPMVVKPNQADTVHLEAHLVDPTTGQEYDIPDTTWKWTLVSVRYGVNDWDWDLQWRLPDSTPWPDWSHPVISKSSAIGATPAYTTALNSGTSQSPTLTSTFQQDGFWTVKLKATATYTDPNTHAVVTAITSHNAHVDMSVQTRRLILLFGYWPHTDIGIDGREGMLAAYKNRIQYAYNSGPNAGQKTNYDVLAITPQFSKYPMGIQPWDLTHAVAFWGKGTNRLDADPLTVDYQATSQDFWKIMKKYHPIAIMSFSRGENDKSWVLEPWATNWYQNEWDTAIPYEIGLLHYLHFHFPLYMNWSPPFIGGSLGDPSPFSDPDGTDAFNGPPDPTKDGAIHPPSPDTASADELKAAFDAWAASLRNTNLTNLRHGDIVTAIKNEFGQANTAKVKPIAPVGPPGTINTSGPGEFVSNFMAYHVAWWRDYSKATFANDDSAKCLFAGHTHVGILVTSHDGSTAVGLQIDTMVPNLPH